MYWKRTYLQYLSWQARYLFNFLVNQMMEIFNFSQMQRALCCVPISSLQQPPAFCCSFSLIPPTHTHPLSACGLKCCFFNYQQWRACSNVHSVLARSSTQLVLMAHRAHRASSTTPSPGSSLANETLIPALVPWWREVSWQFLNTYS